MVLGLKRNPMTAEEASEVALAGFSALAEEPERIARFLRLSGLEPSALREMAGSPAFQAAVLGYVRSDDSLTLVLASRLGIDPMRIADAERLLSGPDTS